MRQVGVPLVVLVGTWVVLAASPWGRTLDLAAYAGRFDAGRRLNLVNSAVLNVISGTTALLGILTLELPLGRMAGVCHRLGAAGPVVDRRDDCGRVGGRVRAERRREPC